MRIRYENRRTLVTLTGIEPLRLKIRRCEAQGCARFHTIANVAMGELRDLPVPLLSSDEQRVVMDREAEYDRLRNIIEELRSNMLSVENDMYSVVLRI